MKNWCALLLICCLVKAKAQISHTAEDYVKIAQDGAWCWFSDPRAIYVEGNYYGGYVDSDGRIWAFAYSPKTQQTRTHQLFKMSAKDDHANPSITTLPDGRLVLFFSGHGGMENTPIYYCVSKKKNDISQWNELQSITSNSEGPRGTCYTNPVTLSAEKNRMYVFFRGADFKPTMVYTDDMKEWSKGKPFIKEASSSNFVRPYMKVATNNKDQIHFAFTDGHPRNEYQNSIYYLRYRNGKYETASGQLVGTEIDFPFAPSQCDKVYDATKTNQRAWIWDVAYDKNDYPVIVYARFISELQHMYYYARWDGKQWINSKITDGGQWFPRFYMPKEGPAREPHYSGGVYLDHNNPDIVYLSKPVKDVFEIQKFTTADLGKTWKTEEITQHSAYDNVRPFVPRNDPASRVMWMYNYDYRAYIDSFHTALRIADVFKGFSPAFKKQDVMDVMKNAADWQIESIKRYRRYNPLDWVDGTLYNGMFQFASIADTSLYFNWLYNIGRRFSWQPGYRMYHADDVNVCQLYLKMYEKYKTKNILMPTQARADWVIANQSSNTELLNDRQERWSWCDALFMAPPVYAHMTAITGDSKYLDFMDQEYKATYNMLFDKDEDLFYRDKSYFDKKEANGKKVFWGRGNGWVLGGLCNIMDYIPKGNPKRAFYEDLFKKMCAKVVKLQGSDGFWRASLLDAESYPSPETSCSGFMVYAFAYGINNNLLDKKTYYPALEKGWKALVSAVNEEGKLGYVQPIGQDPKKVTRDMTELYGVGALLLAGTEIYKMSD